MASSSYYAERFDRRKAPAVGENAAETLIAQCGSGINVANFVSSKLRRDGKRHNYNSWKAQMLCLVESQGLLDFIDNKASRPSPEDGIGYVAWRRTDRLVTGWILGALSDEIGGFASHLDSANDVWIHLEKAFRTPSNDLVTVKLSEGSDWNSYKLWKDQMLSHVQMQNLGDFLEITTIPPPDYHEDYNEWKRSDDMVKGWILEALSDELAKQYGKCYCAKIVWVHLDRTFNAASKLTDQEEKEWRVRLNLCRVAMRGYSNDAVSIMNANPDAIRTRVDLTEESLLHVAVASGKSMDLVKYLVMKLVESSDVDALSIRDSLGYNPLHIAARTGNHEAAKILIIRNPNLLYALSNDKYFPIHYAAEYGHRETVELLMDHTRDSPLLIRSFGFNPFSGYHGFILLRFLICAGLLDIASELVWRFPDLATMRYMVDDDTALSTLASTDTPLNILASTDTAPGILASTDTALSILATVSACPARLNFWESLVYRCTRSEMGCAALLQPFDDIENQNIDQPPRWRKRIRIFISKLVPCVKRIHKLKRMHEQYERGVSLAGIICTHMTSLGPRGVIICIPAMRRAATVGNHEIIQAIVGTFPQAIYATDESSGQNFLHWAVKNRSEKVFNLLYQTTNHRYLYTNTIDSSGNSILHMAAFLAPPHKLNLVSGAALQMQRELQWFEEVSKFVSPFIKDRNNRAGKTPAMIFTEEHKILKVDGEKWMKDTANSCTIAAALIVTVVFAAAITVPGGNHSETGYPMLWKASAFTIFAVSDAISLFTSTTSLLMFLSILTSRYAEQDFLHALPKRLCIGLVTLFLSIFFMMAAFCSTVYLVFGRKHAWVLIPAAALTSLPISSFVLLQFPLLIAVFSSTYGKGIFGKQSNRPFP